MTATYSRKCCALGVRTDQRPHLFGENPSQAMLLELTASDD